MASKALIHSLQRFVSVWLGRVAFTGNLKKTKRAKKVACWHNLNNFVVNFSNFTLEALPDQLDLTLEVTKIYPGNSTLPPGFVRPA